MFKIPDWGEDVPKSNIDVNKLFPSNNKSKKKGNQGNNQNAGNNLRNKSKTKQAVTGKVSKVKNVQQPKYKAKKFINSSPTINNVIKKPENKLHLSHNIDIQNCDTDKLDEVILDAKKKNLIDSYKKEDNEEELFTEHVEKQSKGIKKDKEINVTKLSQSKKIKNDKTHKRNIVKQLIHIKKHSNTVKQTGNNVKSEKLSNNPTGNSKKVGENKANMDKTTLTNDNTDNKDTNIKDESTVLNSDVKRAKIDRKKQIIKTMLESQRNKINVSGNKLRERMLEKLNAAKFRFLNEKLYTSSGSEAQKLFLEDPAAFQTYHQGYQQQLKKWPVNPLDIVVKRIKNLPKTHLIADLGCGEAALSKRVTQTVRSFDLVATAPGVEVCDMAHTPLLSASTDVAVYCLALMGTDLTQFLVEANRILKMSGHLLIAEVESRFDDVDAFAKEVQKIGFTLRKLDKSYKVFYFMEFTKSRDAPVKKSKLPSLYLKPCIYKRR